MGATIGALVLALPAVSDAQTGKPLRQSEKFVKEAAGGGVGEVQLGQLAQAKASSPEVKQFAQRMVEDHSKANEQLKATASQLGVAVPNEPSKDARKAYDKLSKLSGPEFDRAYVRDMVKDHKADVKLFRDEAKNGKDPALQQFAQATLPILEDHLRMIEQIAANKGS
jgi:putative membrane protein